MSAPLHRVFAFASLTLFMGVATAGDGQTKKSSPRTDLYGDPLPQGALARLGSIRFRHAGLSDFVLLDGGRTALTAGGDRVLRFWNLETGKQTRTVALEGNAGPGHCVTVSPDGKTLAASVLGNLVFWEVETGKKIKSLPSPNVGLTPHTAYLLFSPDSKTLAVGNGNWRVSFLDLQTGKERDFPLPVHPRQALLPLTMDSTFQGSFSPNGKWFVAGAASREPLGVFEVATAREVHRLDCFAYSSVVSPDSKRLAVCSSQNDKGERETLIRLFDLESGKETAQIPMGTNDPIYKVAFSPDGNVLACGFSERSCLFNLRTGQVLHQMSDRSWALAFAPNGKTLVGRANHRLRVWDVETGKERHDRPGDFASGLILATSPDSRFVAAVDWTDRTVSLWETASGRLSGRLPLKGDARYVVDLRYSGDGQTLAACQTTGLLQFWDVATGKERRVVQLRDPAAPNDNPPYFHALHVSPDGKHVSALERVVGAVMQLTLWETATGKPVGPHAYLEEMWQVAWLGGGKTAAVPQSDGLTLVDLPTSRICFHIAEVTLEGYGHLATSRDDRLLAGPKKGPQGTDGRSSTVTVWETVTGKEVASVSIDRAGHLALAPNNRSLIATADRILSVWDLATGKERGRWNMPVPVTDSWSVHALHLSSDGQQAFTALADGTVLVWDLSLTLRPAAPLATEPGEKEFAAWWADLAHEDASRAYAAVWRLEETPHEKAIAFLRKHLRPAPEPDLKEIRRLITDLHSDTFAVRDKAFKRLDEFGNAAEAELRATLNKASSLELHRRVEKLLSRPRPLDNSPEALRALRAIGVLEQIASKDAKSLLEELSRGAAHAAATQEARASIERLWRRPVER